MNLRKSEAALIVAMAVGGIPAGCGGAVETATVQRPIVYGSDDRTEYFEVSSPAARTTMEGSVVALVPRSLVRIDNGTVAPDAPSLAATDNLCPGEPFAAEPAAAFCSGVLVDWDLILTAGHCDRLLALDDFVVVRGYYYDSPGHLAVSSTGDIQGVDGIVAEALDPEGADPRLDFAWLHLSRPVRPPWQPAPISVGLRAGVVGQPIVSIGAGGGAPLKLDDGGQIRQAREASLDYFTADTDTSHGSSGGGAFDQSLTLLGVLARGGPDLVETVAGCNVNAGVSDGTSADEEFTYVARAVAALCDDAKYPSSICRADCGEPCVALPPVQDAGCAVTGGGSTSRPAAIWSFVVGAAIFERRRRFGTSPARRRSQPGTMGRCDSRPRCRSSPRWR